MMIFASVSSIKLALMFRNFMSKIFICNLYSLSLLMELLLLSLVHFGNIS